MKTSLSKKTLLFFLLALAAFPLFAQEIPARMQTLANTIYNVFNSDLIRVILAIFLCGAGIAYAFNKDNEKVKRNAIAILIGAAIILSAKEIVAAVWRAS